MDSLYRWLSGSGSRRELALSTDALKYDGYLRSEELTLNNLGRRNQQVVVAPESSLLVAAPHALNNNSKGTG
jgi:hypothetical protein